MCVCFRALVRVCLCVWFTCVDGQGESLGVLAIQTSSSAAFFASTAILPDTYTHTHTHTCTHSSNSACTYPTSSTPQDGRPKSVLPLLLCLSYPPLLSARCKVGGGVAPFTAKTCVFKRVFVCMYVIVCMCVSLFVCDCLHVFMRVHVCVRVCVCVHVC